MQPKIIGKTCIERCCTCFISVERKKRTSSV